MAKIDAIYEDARRAKAAQEILKKVASAQTNFLVNSELSRVRVGLEDNAKKSTRKVDVGDPLSVYQWALGSSVIADEIAFSPIARAVVGDFYKEIMPVVNDQAEQEKIKDEEERSRKHDHLRLAQKALIGTMAVGTVVTALAGGHWFWMRATSQEITKLEGAVTNVVKAQDNLRWEPSVGRAQEKFAEPRKAVAEMDKAILTIEVPLAVAERLASVRNGVWLAYQDRIFVAGDPPPLPEARAVLEEEKGKLQELVNGRVAEIKTPLFVPGVAAGLAVAGSLMFFWASEVLRERVGKKFIGNEYAREQNLRYIEGVAARLNPVNEEAS